MSASGVFRDRTGDRYGRLVVIELSSRLERKSTGGYKRFWNCLCDCGNKVEVCAGNLSGNTQSCGCLLKERLFIDHYKHGASGAERTAEYNAWCAIKRRCFGLSGLDYPEYGGRGITVCARWLDKFENFLEDMGQRPSLKHSIERKDNNGNYEPSNCYWATKKEQANNTRGNTRIEYLGENLTLSQWSEKTGFSYTAIVQRLAAGWTPSEIFETPIRVRNNPV